MTTSDHGHVFKLIPVSQPGPLSQPYKRTWMTLRDYISEWIQVCEQERKEKCEADFDVSIDVNYDGIVYNKIPKEPEVFTPLMDQTITLDVLADWSVQYLAKDFYLGKIRTICWDVIRSPEIYQLLVRLFTKEYNPQTVQRVTDTLLRRIFDEKIGLKGTVVVRSEQLDELRDLENLFIPSLVDDGIATSSHFGTSVKSSNKN